MAKLTITIPRKISWRAPDMVELYVGTENAASLAASTPAGGRKVAEIPALQGAVVGGWGRGRWGAFGWGRNPAMAFGWGSSGSQWGRGYWGRSLLGPVVMVHEHLAADKCADLPVGAKLRDAVGNRSVVVEAVAAIADPPRGARPLVAAGTEVAGEVELSWTESADV